MPNTFPMSTFDPSKPCQVLNVVTDPEWFIWNPEQEAHYRQYAAWHDEEQVVIAWDGMLLAGWLPPREE